jgi:hypothetical protein
MAISRNHAGPAAAEDAAAVCAGIVDVRLEH